MRILILVLSYNASPFDVLMRTQQSTFDSVDVDGVETIYYYGGGNDKPDVHIARDVYPYSTILQFPCTDEYYLMAAKLKYCLQVINLDQYQYIFRTNSSSYISKPALIEFSKTLPTDKLYAGWSFIDSEDFGGGCISGAGIWLTPDTAKILMDEIDPEKLIEEDVYCGRILRKHGITAIDDKSRYDVQNIHDFIPLDLYHYRCKTGNRTVDAHNMVMLHKKIISQ